MGIGDGDQQEALNIKREEAINKQLLERTKKQNSACEKLSKEYRKILKQAKRVANIIKKKNEMNTEELQAEWGKIQTEENMGRLKGLGEKLKEDQKNESELSKEEAIIIQEMLTKLHESITTAQAILKEDNDIYTMLNEMYAKDMQDYQLEAASSKKA